MRKKKKLLMIALKSKFNKNKLETEKENKTP